MKSARPLQLIARQLQRRSTWTNGQWTTAILQPTAAAGVSDPRSTTMMTLQRFSSMAQESTSGSGSSYDYYTDVDGPSGDLFPPKKHHIGPSLIGKTGRIQRVFGPSSNAQAMLVTGGEALAAHASFDPNYRRATDWIRYHAVGPAVLSPVLITGLTGALVEAAFPQAVVVKQDMSHIRPLIVGVAVHAQITVVDVAQGAADPKKTESYDDPERRKRQDTEGRNYGYQVRLQTQVLRVRDDAIISEGEHVLWIPDYVNM